MKTVYFPFTVIDPRQAERLAAVWGPVTLLQPSEDTVLPELRRFQEAGTIHLLVPSEAPRESGLQAALEAFEQWAAQHVGSDRGILLELARAFPLFDSRFPAQLASDIRQGGRRPEATRTTAGRSALFEAQLFLALAQKFDRQQVELARDIEALAAEEQKMLALLKGDEVRAERLTEASGSSPPAGATAMLDLRLRAWARVMAAARDRAKNSGWPENETLFVTDAADLPAHLEERFPEMVYRLRSGATTGTKQFHGDLAALPAWLVGADGAIGAAVARRAREAGCDLIEIPGAAPPDFLEHLAGGRSGPQFPASPGMSAATTWIGYHPRLDHTTGDACGAGSKQS